MVDLNIPPAPLPTLDRLGVPPTSISPDLDAKKIAHDWLDALSKAISEGKIDIIVNDLLLPDAFWRDMLALTWDLRTFSGKDKIRTFLTDRLALSKLHDFKMRDDYTGLQQPYPDLLWISLMFDFENDVGGATGIARLVPTTANGDWKAHVVFTNLDSLRDFPEKLGPLRDFQPSHGVWEDERRRQTSFEGREDPKVLIIGAGQSGLETAARLKMLGVDSLIVDRNERIGDNWRKRYEALCLHDPVWYDHMPYLPFPPNWPVYAPAQKVSHRLSPIRIST